MQNACSTSRKYANCALGVLFAAALFALLLCLAAPAKAWARYTDVSTQYPAAQDLSETAREGLAAIGKTIYPEVISAGDIVDGTYIVPAYTSSRMCNFYASRENATSKYAPNQVVLNVSGGVVTATFYLSGAYTAVYFGTADAAAALAPAGGLTPSPYYITDGSDSYDTGHGPFTMQLPSLNTEFTFAVYNGGTKGVEGGLWYTRLGAVIVTDDFAESYVIGANSDPRPQPDPSDNPGTDPGVGGGDGGEGSAPQPEPEAGQDQQEAQQTPVNYQAENPVALGKRLTIVGADQEDGGGQQTVLQGALLQLGCLTPGQMAGIGLAVLLVLGAVLSVVRFRLQLRSRDE